MGGLGTPPPHRDFKERKKENRQPKRGIHAAQDEGAFGEWLDELPFEVAAATARLLKHHARSGAWVEISPGNPSQAPRAGRDRDRSSPNCPSDMSELSENSD